MKTQLKHICFFASLPCVASAALHQQPSHFIFEAGAFQSHTGQTQQIPIQNLVGDRFTMTHKTATSGVLGLGYFLQSRDLGSAALSFGAEGFYLGKSSVFGKITQELLFDNLGFEYRHEHVPLLAVAKAHLPTQYDNLTMTLQGGVGVNFFRTSAYHDYPLDNITLPDNAFQGQTRVQPAASVGFGFATVDMHSQHTMECGYRFFFLGNGTLKQTTSEVQRPLKTGRAWAHAMLCSMTY